MMNSKKKWLYLIFIVAILLNTLWPSSASAQTGKGTITGSVTDTGHDVLPSAPVKLDPVGISVTTNAQGEFTITDLTPGTYTVTVSYLGFAPFTMSVTVTAGQV